MSRLYISNVSPQRQIICYRLLTDRNGDPSDYMRAQAPKQEVIPAGKQIAIGADFHKAQIASILEQLEPYGIISVDDVPNSLNRVTELVYSVDREAPKRILEAVQAFNNGEKISEGALRRQRVAIAANQVMSAQIGEVPKVFDVEFEQEEVSDLGEKAITEGFHVVKNIEDTDKGPKVLSRRKA